MEVEEVLAQLGGTATRARLLHRVSVRQLQRAVEAGRVERAAHGRYRLPSLTAAEAAIGRIGGTLACLSAAQAAGWETVRPPDRPWLAVPRARSRVDARGVHLIFSDERETDPVRIVLQCARHLPWPEALAVADSALRSGQVDRDELIVAAAALRGPGGRAARRVAAAASARKASVLESVMHALVLDVPGLDVEPQARIDLGSFAIHPDLVDRRLRTVVEAEGWAFHGSSPEAFDRDVERYTLLVVRGWRVLRFTHHQVMHQQEWVREMLRAFVSTCAMQREDAG